MKPKDKMCIFLVRHGETAWNVKRKIQGSSDIPINKKGVKQAVVLAKKFKGVGLTHIYSSPLLRAKQTAMIIGKSHKLKIRTVKDLRERSLGVLEGLSTKDIDKKYPNFVHEWQTQKIDWSFKGSETIRELMDRAMRAFKKIVYKHKLGDRVLIVSHGGPLRSVIHLLHGGKPLDFWHTRNLDNAEIVEVHWDGKKAKIVSAYR